jgi:hypothetical protein
VFEGVKKSGTLQVIFIRMQDFQRRLKRGERLTEDEEKQLKRNLLGEEAVVKGIEFKDDKQRDRLLDEWFKRAKILYETLREKEKKE